MCTVERTTLGGGVICTKCDDDQAEGTTGEW